MDKSDVIIIGGVAAGPKTAATLARRNPNLKITVFEKSEHISFGTCGLPYFASGDVNSFNELTFTPYGVPRDREFFKKSKGFDIRTETEVISIDRDKKTVSVKNTTSGETFDHEYSHLVITTGATANKPPFPIPNSPKIRHFTRPEDAINFRQSAQTGQIGKAVIIGAGFIGCELAEAVGGMWGIETILLEKENQLLPYVLDPEMSSIVERELANNDIDIKTGCSVTGIKLNGEGNPIVHINGDDYIEADYVFMALGVTPNVNLAQACGLTIGSSGGIDVNDKLQTSDSNIYAGGDCVESESLVTGKKFIMPMGSLANRHGRVIAENICGQEAKFPGVTGAFLVKVLETNVGTVGLSECAAEKAGIDFDAVWGAFLDKPDFYPEAKNYTLKMVYEKKSHRLLGLQAIGAGDIFRRIDTFSSFLLYKATIDDLLNFEHGYAPPYSEALDPLHHLASMAKAKQDGYNIINPVDLSDDENTFWLDVREIEEATEAPMILAEKLKETGRFLNIPLGNLRENIEGLDKNKRIKVICRRGPRSYQAAVILRSAGFEDIQIIGGGTQAVQG